MLIFIWQTQYCCTHAFVLLQLSGAFKFTPELRNAYLPGNPLVPKTVCQVSGWGYPDSVSIEWNKILLVPKSSLQLKKKKKQNYCTNAFIYIDMCNISEYPDSV